MGMIRLIASVLITLVLLSSSLFAGGFEISGVGVKAKGMGGAFRAIADDWTAAYYNPAGLAFVMDNQLGVSSGFEHFRHELTPEYYYYDEFDNAYGVGIFNDRTLYNHHEIHFLPSFGAVARLPFWGEAVLGLSAFQPFDNNLIWKVWESPLAYNDSIAYAMHDDQLESDIDVVAFQVTLAREFKEDELSMGLGLQLLRADLFYKNLVFRDNPMDAPLDDRPFDRIPEFTKNDGTGWGFGLNFGMQWKLNEKTTAAATLQIPFSITVSGQTEFTFVMPKGSPYLPYNPGTEEYLFTSGDAVTPEAEFETELKLPMSFAVGFAHQLSEKVTLALDAEYTAWSSFEGFDFAYSSFVDLPEGPGEVYLAEDFFVHDLSSPADWDNTFKIMLGASWEATDALTLLGGVFMDQSPLSSSDLVTPHFVDPGDKLGINGGLLFSAQRWELGLTTSYISTSDDQDVTSLIDIDGDGIHDSFAALYSASTYETTFSVNYRF